MYHGLARRLLLPSPVSGCGRSLTAVRWAGDDMGINALLKRESGEVLGAVGDPTMVLSRAVRSDAFSTTRLLKYLVPWGDTVFNQAQAGDVEFDIANVKRTANDSQLVELLTAIEPLVSQLSAETHAYLWFIGD
jgi:hypothetical protein